MQMQLTMSVNPPDGLYPLFFIALQMQSQYARKLETDEHGSMHFWGF